MASKSAFCSICELQNISKSSEIWCSECEEALCVDCNKHHSLSKGTRNHQTVPITEYQKLPENVLQISLFCNNHHEKYQMFCKKHDYPCCRRCIIESHIECKNIEVIDDVTKNVKSSTCFLDVERSLADLAGNIVRLREDRKQNLKLLRESRHKIEREIKQTRMKINNHFDQLEKDIMTKLEVVEESQATEIRKILSQLEQNEAEIEKFCNTIANIKQHASDLQIFLTMKQIESEVMRNEHSLQSIHHTDGMKQIDLSCKLDKSLLTLSDIIKNFGEIIVDSKPNEVTITTQKDKEAQIILHHVLPPSIDQITLQLEQTINTKSSNVRGCTVLPDGGMVFTYYTSYLGKVHFVNKDGSEAFDLKVDAAYDVVYIEEDNAVAVTSGSYSPQCVQIIDIKKRKVTKTIKVGSPIYGAVIKGHNLIFSARYNGIRMLNMTDETVSDILKVNLIDYSYITIFNDNLYFTDYNDTVICCDFNGTIQWKFKNESLLKNPEGITVDNYGNLYVIGYGSLNVVMISPDGQRSRQIISSEDGLGNPSALHFDKQMNTMLVANCQNSAFLFRIKTVH